MLATTGGFATSGWLLFRFHPASGTPSHKHHPSQYASPHILNCPHFTLSPYHGTCRGGTSARVSLQGLQNKAWGTLG